MAAIIFDFDGTIADSFEFVAGYLMKTAGVTAEKPEDMEYLRGMSMVAIARGLGHPWWKLPRLFIDGRHNMKKAVSKLEPFEGMPEVIRKAHAEGHELFILSSNSVHTLHKFLHQHKMHTHFLELYGGVSLFGKAKALRRLLKENNLDVKDCIYIGDELRDVEASKSVGMRVIAVGWGFARTSDFKKLHPTAIVLTPDELMARIEEV